jgi:hypothetical protein
MGIEILDHVVLVQPATVTQYPGGAERRVAGERQLAARREDPDAVVGARVGGREQERRLAQVRPIGEGGHLRIGQCICADNNGQRVAAQRPRGENVDLLKREIGHGTAPLD